MRDGAKVGQQETGFIAQELESVLEAVTSDPGSVT
jgi:hypothetical protein